ncbi:MAG TPA: hypothetical protein VK166_10705 [Chitinophagaceae bacterium]|nr:hypothetical protein [Chitinophagaceae bacterium]
MKQLFSFVLCFLASYFLTAQEVKKVYTVNPGQTLDEGLPFEVRYAYPEFKAGFAHFRNGNLGGSKMNYNYLISEMQFINGADTVSVNKAEDIKFIVIEKDTFYYVKGWVRQLATSGEVKLGEKKSLAFSNREKIGAFGTSGGGSSIDAVENVSTVSNIQKSLEAKQMLSFAEYSVFYFADRFGEYRQATKKSLANMFGKNHPGFEKFLEEGKFNYFSETDMKKVYDYLIQH